MIELASENPLATGGTLATVAVALRYLWAQYGPSLRARLASRETPTPHTAPDVLGAAAHFAALRAHYLATDQSELADLMDQHLAVGVFRTAGEEPRRTLRIVGDVTGGAD